MFGIMNEQQQVDPWFRSVGFSRVPSVLERANCHRTDQRRGVVGQDVLTQFLQATYDRLVNGGPCELGRCCGGTTVFFEGLHGVTT